MPGGQDGTANGGKHAYFGQYWWNSGPIRVVRAGQQGAGLRAERPVCSIKTKAIRRCDRSSPGACAMGIIRVVKYLAILFFGFQVNISAGSSDHPGTQDHPKIPGIDGTHIIGYAYSDYDEGTSSPGCRVRN